MARVGLNYDNYGLGDQYYNSICRVLEATTLRIGSIREAYDNVDSSIFETNSFPLNTYIDDLKKAIGDTTSIMNSANELADYATTNFKNAEDAIEEDINKFKEKMHDLFDGLEFDGFHFQSENLVYWEPGVAGYTAQGYTETDEYKIISAYKKGSNSRLYYYDKKTGEYIGYVELNNQAHVGGTAYDPDDNLIFVTGDDGKVNCYDHKAIETALNSGRKSSSGGIVIDLNNKAYSGIEVECDIDIKDELRTKDAATIYYHDGKIYVATYRTKGDLVSYDINCDRKNGKVNLDVGEMHVVSHNCPSAVQGISIFEKDGKTYVAFARSAKLSPSSVDIYELNDDETLGDLSGSVSFNHHGLEGIEVHDDGSITGIYEFEGATTLDVNVDNVIGNGRKNPHDTAYYHQAKFWNKYIKRNGNHSYDDAIWQEEHPDYYYQ